MVEMLGVLAVMGVLSVVGIAGVKNAMEKNRANTIISEAQKRAVAVAGQIGFNNGTPSLADFSAHNTVSGGTFGDVVTTGLTGQFGIPVSGVSQKVCQNILNTLGDKTSIRRLSLSANPRVPIVGCEDSNDFLIVYNNDMKSGESDTEYCLNHDDCDECGTCNQTTHTCIGKCESACNENDTCGENECVVCDEDSKTCQNKCEKVEYLESNDNTNWISLDYKPTINTDFEVKLRYNTTNLTTWVLGATTWWGCHIIGSENKIGIANGASNKVYAEYTKGTDITLKLDGISVYVDGSLIGTITKTNATSNLDLFRYYNASNLWFPGRIYYFKVYENSLLKRDFIPVLSPDGEACMFDKVSQKLFCNAGSGTFKTNLDE